MTILCLVRDKNGGGWAAFADCLITSDLQDQGFSLSTPMRPNYGTKKTFGFSEEALEEKIGLIEKDILLGWAGEKSEAVRALSEFKARQSDDEFTRIFANKKNCYLLIQRKEDGNSRIRFIGAEGHLHRIESCGYEFIFSGTGRKIIQDFRFTARGKLRLGENAPNAIWAALRAVARFFSEEMAGQTSQFYSLRTGGHYRIFYGSPKGIQQFYFAVNHWIMNEEHEPVVNSLVLPYVKDQYELSIEVKGMCRPRPIEISLAGGVFGAFG